MFCHAVLGAVFDMLWQCAQTVIFRVRYTANILPSQLLLNDVTFLFAGFISPFAKLAELA